LRRFFGFQQALGDVGHRKRLLPFFAQFGDFDAQPRELGFGVAVESGDVLAELERPKRQCRQESEQHSDDGPSNRPGQVAANDHARRADRQPAAQQLPAHQWRGPLAGPGAAGRTPASEIARDGPSFNMGNPVRRKSADSRSAFIDRCNTKATRKWPLSSVVRQRVSAC
jgi:hypothetical protein